MPHLRSGTNNGTSVLNDENTTNREDNATDKVSDDNINVKNAAQSSDPDQVKFILYFKEALKDPDITSCLKTLVTPKDLQAAISTEVKKQLQPLKMQIEEKDATIKRLEHRIRQLQIKDDEQEQYSRRECLRFGGLREEELENVDEKIVKICNEKLNISPPITKEDIARSHRIGKRNGNAPRQVIVKFNSYRIRAGVYKKKKALAGTPVSVNEDLTRERAKLLYRAREAKRAGKIKGCWSYDGRIGLEDTMSKIHTIVTREQLDKLIGIDNTAHPEEDDYV